MTKSLENFVSLTYWIYYKFLCCGIKVIMTKCHACCMALRIIQHEVIFHDKRASVLAHPLKNKKMGVGRWIGGFLGFINGGPLGALAGYAIGWLFEKGAEGFSGDDAQYSDGTYRNTWSGEGGTYQSGGYSARQQYEGQRNSFLFSLLVLAAYIIKADGRVMHSEMECVRTFLRRNFGEAAVQQGEQILLRLFERQKQMGNEPFKATIRESCADMAQHMDYAQRLQLVNFLVMIAQADGSVPQSEIDAMQFVAANLGVSSDDLDSMLNLSSGGSSLEAAYKVLGLTPDATDDDVKAAYRRMALKHHPDRVATLGEDVRKAAEQKFQEINAAKETIYKARGL